MARPRPLLKLLPIAGISAAIAWGAWQLGRRTAPPSQEPPPRAPAAGPEASPDGKPPPRRRIAQRVLAIDALNLPLDREAEWLRWRRSWEPTEGIPVPDPAEAAGGEHALLLRFLNLSPDAAGWSEVGLLRETIREDPDLEERLAVAR